MTGTGALGRWSLLGTFNLDAEEVLHLLAHERGRRRSWADEPGDVRRALDSGPDIIVHEAADEDVTRQHLLRDGDLATVLELVDVFHGNLDVEDLVLESTSSDEMLEVGLHLLLITRVGVDHVPTTRQVVGALDARLVDFLNGVIDVVDDQLVDLNRFSFFNGIGHSYLSLKQG